jgi:hypothetical protein
MSTSYMRNPLSSSDHLASSDEGFVMDNIQLISEYDLPSVRLDVSSSNTSPGTSCCDNSKDCGLIGPYDDDGDQ